MSAVHDQAAWDVPIPPELKEATFTGVRNFLHARRYYESRLQDCTSKTKRQEDKTDGD